MTFKCANCLKNLKNSWVKVNGWQLKFKWASEIPGHMVIKDKTKVIINSLGSEFCTFVAFLSEFYTNTQNSMRSEENCPRRVRVVQDIFRSNQKRRWECESSDYDSGLYDSTLYQMQLRHCKNWDIPIKTITVKDYRQGSDQFISFNSIQFQFKLDSRFFNSIQF